jgi:hypothetical protein
MPKAINVDLGHKKLREGVDSPKTARSSRDEERPDLGIPYTASANSRYAKLLRGMANSEWRKSDASGRNSGLLIPDATTEESGQTETCDNKMAPK